MDRVVRLLRRRRQRKYRKADAVKDASRKCSNTVRPIPHTFDLNLSTVAKLRATITLFDVVVPFVTRRCNVRETTILDIILLTFVGNTNIFLVGEFLCVRIFSPQQLNNNSLVEEFSL
jgi:hypothetical protein